MFDRQSYIKQDSPVKKILLRLFKETDPLNIFDIGACEGEESIRYRKIFINASLFLFEPLPKNQLIINDNIKNKNLVNAILFPLALSDVNGYTKFYTSSGQPNNLQIDVDWDFGNKSSSLLAPQLKNLPDWMNFNEIDVQTLTLRSFLEENAIENIDFVHMDVQGAELKVLEGAKEKIENIKAIWLEVSNVELYKNQPLRNDIEMFMKENHFQLIKSDFSGEFGDQFYLNRKHFKIYSFFKGLIQFYKKR